VVYPHLAQGNLPARGYQQRVCQICFVTDYCGFPDIRVTNRQLIDMPI
jgi:hypothetical protein